MYTNVVNVKDGTYCIGQTTPKLSGKSWQVVVVVAGKWKSKMRFISVASSGNEHQNTEQKQQQQHYETHLPRHKTSPTRTANRVFMPILVKFESIGSSTYL